MIQDDNKMLSTRRGGHKRIIKEKSKQSKKENKYFDYSEFPDDDFFFAETKIIPKFDRNRKNGRDNQ